MRKPATGDVYKRQVITMEKTMTLNLRVNPTVKQQAEDVLKQLGIPVATAIDMYLRQITLTGGIPFSLSLPKAPAALNADTMTDDQLHAALQVGIKEIQNGDTVNAASAFAQLSLIHILDTNGAQIDQSWLFEKDDLTYIDIAKTFEMCIRDRYKAGRSLYWERPAVFMLQQARLVKLPALSALSLIHI